MSLHGPENGPDPEAGKDTANQQHLGEVSLKGATHEHVVNPYPSQSSDFPYWGQPPEVVFADRGARPPKNEDGTPNPFVL